MRAYGVPAMYKWQAKVRIVSLLLIRWGEKGLQALCHIVENIAPLSHCVGKLDKGVVGKVRVRDREADPIFALNCAIKQASAVSNSYRIRHFYTIAHPVSQNGSPERSPVPPRVVPATAHGSGCTGLCAACLRAAVTRLMATVAVRPPEAPRGTAARPMRAS